MRITIAILLLLFPAVAFTSDNPSVALETYLADVQYQIESILAKCQIGQATDYDEFMLTKLQERLNGLTTSYVSRSSFTPQIINREPTANVTVAPRNSQVFYFTELSNLAGATVEHVWLVEGIVVHRIAFQIGSNRWRTYSSVSTRNAPNFKVLVYANGYLISVKSLTIQ